MFNPHIDPKRILIHVFQEMVAVLQNIEVSGFPIQATPPHNSSVFLAFEDNSERVGIVRSEPHILTKIDQGRWLSFGVFQIQENVKNTAPIGCFFGVICTLAEVGEEDNFLYVGILTSPIGENAVGCYCPISNLDTPPLLIKDIDAKFQFLSETLQTSQQIH